MCLAWLEAQKLEIQSPGFASQAKPNSGLDGGLGFDEQNFQCGWLMNNPRLTTKKTPLVFQTVFPLNLSPDG
jgi:hypothetical protein